MLYFFLLGLLLPIAVGLFLMLLDFKFGVADIENDSANEKADVNNTSNLTTSLAPRYSDFSSIYNPSIPDNDNNNINNIPVNKYPSTDNDNYPLPNSC